MTMAINWRIEIFDTLESTQKFIKDRAASGEAEGLVVQAREQSGGKGRYGREWVSPKGNLYLSILLKPECAASEAAQFSFVAALAVSAAIDEYIKDRSLKFLKWPNDVFLDGKKCAGILLETELDKKGNVEWLVLGVGVNIVSAPDIGVAVQDYADKGIDLEGFRDNLLKQLSFYKTKEFQEIRALWLERAHEPGTKLQIKLGESVEAGYFHDIDENGNLLLRIDGGDIQMITAGDVYVIGS
ncbi:MAG: hypothetical protein DHS20C02_06450 [Micavibrio sp.]|nr:MAG: hypothetical protein DHS20C02_06450 [Micavibrio sp.]